MLSDVHGPKSKVRSKEDRMRRGTWGRVIRPYDLGREDPTSKGGSSWGGVADEKKRRREKRWVVVDDGSGGHTGSEEGPKPG